MTIHLNEIYAGLKAWRLKRIITVKSQRQGYIVNIMEELGELAGALRDYERFQNELKTCDDKEYLATAWHYNNEKAEHAIIDALCDIAVFTINAGADMPCDIKPKELFLRSDDCFNFNKLFKRLSLYADAISFGDYTLDKAKYFESVLEQCAKLCQDFNFNFELAMLETIKEISSRTGVYDENSKKWIKDTSDEAKAKWYSADYEKARVEK